MARRYPAWIVAELSPGKKDYAECLRDVARPVMEACAGEPYVRFVFYDFHLPGHRVNLYVAAAPGGLPAAERRLGRLLSQSRTTRRLKEHRVAAFGSRGGSLTVDVLGGERSVRLIEEFSHWGSWACLRYFGYRGTMPAVSSRVAFAIALHDVLLNSLGFSRPEKIACITSWKDYLEDILRRKDRQKVPPIDYSAMDRLFETRRESLKNYLAGGAGEGGTGHNLGPILQTYAEKLGPVARKTGPFLARMPSKQDRWRWVGHRLTHLNWIRLAFYNLHELQFLHLYQRVLGGKAASG